MSQQPAQQQVNPYPHSPQTYQADISWEQFRQLLAPLHPDRVGHANGQSNMQAYEVRFHMNRIFGFGGWDEDVSDMRLEKEIYHQNRYNEDVVTVIYICSCLVTVRTPDGGHFTSKREWATGAAQGYKVANIAEAYNMAVKTAESQAFKRAVVNLGDQFGLSLYAKGSTQAIGGWSMVQPRIPEDQRELEAGPAREVPAAVAETDPDADPTVAQDYDESTGAWTQTGSAREQAVGGREQDTPLEPGPDDVMLHRARQDNAAEASQTRPHPNSVEPDAPAEPGSQTHLDGAAPVQAEGPPAWAPAGKEDPKGGDFLWWGTGNVPKSRDQWRAAWTYYRGKGVPGWKYFIKCCMAPASNCPEFIKAQLVPVLNEMEGQGA